MGGGKTAYGFGPDRIRTLVSMATGSPHRVIIGIFFSADLIGSFFIYLQVTRTCMKARRISKFAQIGQPTAELCALKRLKKKIPMENGVSTFSAIFDLVFFVLTGNNDIHKSLD